MSKAEYRVRCLAFLLLPVLSVPSYYVSHISLQRILHTQEHFSSWLQSFMQLRQFLRTYYRRIKRTQQSWKALITTMKKVIIGNHFALNIMKSFRYFYWCNINRHFVLFHAPFVCSLFKRQFLVYCEAFAMKSDVGLLICASCQIMLRQFSHRYRSH